MYLKPVKVSSDWKPYFFAISASAGEDTKEHANTPFSPFAWYCFAKYHPKKQPTTLPCKGFQLPCASGTATAKRSASGSLAIMNSALCSFATLMAKSNAPFSSGLGKFTVGNVPSGHTCSATI